MHKGHLTMGNADYIASRQSIVALDLLTANQCPVAAAKVANRPATAGQKDLGVIATTAIILDHYLVGRSPADRNRPTRCQPEYVGPFRSFANDEIC